MKTFITFITLIILFFWGSATSVDAQFIQNRTAGAPGVHQLIVQHGDQLNLTTEQKEQLIALQLERRSDLQRTTRRDARVRGDVRNQRRSPGQMQGTRGTRQFRSDRYAGYSEAIYEILTDEQISELQSIRTQHAEMQHELRILRNQMLVERAELEGDKVAETLELLNEISEQRKLMQVKRIENPNERNVASIQENLNEIRTIHDTLRNRLTVAEYEALMPVMRNERPFNRGNRASGRTMMRRR